MYHKNINKKYILLLLKCAIILQKMAATGPLPVLAKDQLRPFFAILLRILTKVGYIFYLYFCDTY